VGRPACARCGTPTAFETFVCDACKNFGFGFESARAPLRFEGVGEEIVHALKYRGYTRLGEKLTAPLRLEVLDRAARRFDAVVPVPLHGSRLRRRGLNQAEVLARGVAAGLDAPVSDTLGAARKTWDQVELTGGERRTNVEGAYAVRGRASGRVLLVDDVLATGATISS
jgi:competence protein ComFC